MTINKLFVVSSRFYSAAVLLFLMFSIAGNLFAQKQKTSPKNNVANLPKVTQIDAAALKNLLKPNGKPLLVNFWATWCDPCREEFPDLVKIDAEYRGKIDLITVSLDDLAEINRDVPKFLSEMQAQMPSYLLKTDDDEAAIASVSPEWKGGLPFTILLDANGTIVYSRQAKFEPQILRTEINKVLSPEVKK